MKDKPLTRYQCRDIVRAYQEANNPVTYNGKPARITGFALDFANILCNGAQTEYSWQAVYSVITSKGGNFKG